VYIIIRDRNGSVDVVFGSERQGVGNPEGIVRYNCREGQEKEKEEKQGERKAQRH
jgi:hypothetical protein